MKNLLLLLLTLEMEKYVTTIIQSDITISKLVKSQQLIFFHVNASYKIHFFVHHSNAFEFHFRSDYVILLRFSFMSQFFPFLFYIYPSPWFIQWRKKCVFISFIRNAVYFIKSFLFKHTIIWIFFRFINRKQKRRRNNILY